MDKTNLWSAIAALIPADAICWRQDGKAMQRDGKWFARFVCYIDAGTVRERLDSVVPGEWDLTLDLLPQLPNSDGVVQIAFKARLQILGVIREDVGVGDDYKAAATDAFKRAAVRFGIGHELYTFEPNWVPVDGDGRYAKPLEDPADVYARKYGPRAWNAAAARAENARTAPAPTPREQRTAPVPTWNDPTDPDTSIGPPRTARPSATTPPGVDGDAVRCPKCEGRMWDNRATKRSPKAPDFKCRDRSCDGVIWPPRDAKPAAPATVPPADAADDAPPFDDDDLPF